MTTAKSGAAPTGAKEPDAMMGAFQNGWASGMSVPQKLMEANMQTGAELLAFMSRRINSQAGLLAEFGHCHGVGEAIEAQRKFVASLTKDYTDEAAYLTDIARRNMDAVTNVLAHQAGQTAGNAHRPKGGGG